MAGTIKRISGIAMLIVGVIGVALCVLAVVETWSTAARLRGGTSAVLEKAETFFGSIRRQGETAGGVLAATGDRLDSIRSTVEELSVDRERRKVADLLDDVDPELLRRLENAEEFVRSMRGSLHNAGSALLLLDSIPLLSPQRPRSTDRESGGDSAKLASGLSEISVLLEQILNLLTEIRSRKTVDDRQLAQLGRALGRIEDKLGRVRSQIAAFSAELESAESQLGEMRSRGPSEIDRLSSLATVFLVCFGFSQVALACHGWSVWHTQIIRAKEIEACDVPHTNSIR